MDDIREKMRELVSVLNDAAYRYYVLDNPCMSDSEYDALYDQLIALERETGERLGDSPTRHVGGAPLTSFISHKHQNRMWSMDKCRSKAELLSWLQKTEKSLGVKPAFFTEYKLDGLALCLTYENGALVQAATRGNGEMGESVLLQVKTIKSIPRNIPYQGFMEVHGECFMKLSVLNEYNQTAAEPLRNARNAAAGALRNLDPAITASRKLSAFFYNVVGISDPPFSARNEIDLFLRENHFPVSPLLSRSESYEQLYEVIDAIERERNDLDFLIDGAVVSVDQIAYRSHLGYTDKFPRWCIAYKFKAEEAVTLLNAVTWEVGRTGKLTPLGHLNETDFMGVTVKRATLNNYGDILRKQIAIGSFVRLRRSNDVIPEIVGRAAGFSPNEKLIEKPSVCPACGYPVTERGANLYCDNNLSCKPQAIARLTHYASRDAMDIEGLSDKTCGLLYDYLSVRDPADLYALSINDLTNLDGFGQKKAQNLANAIHKNVSPRLDAFLFALGIPNVGKKTARDLADRFKTSDAVANAVFEDLIQMEDVGDIIARSVVSFFKDDRVRVQLNRLSEMGIKPRETETRVGGDFLNGLTIVVTGTLTGYTRQEAENVIRLNGGKPAGSVSAKTSFVLAGENAGSKLEKAMALGIPVLTEDMFNSRIKSNS